MYSKYWRIGVAVVAMTMVVICSAASASRLEIPNGSRGFRFGRINSTEFITTMGSINCELQLSGTWRSRTITKSAGAVIGEVNTGQLVNCSEGQIGLMLTTGTIPWEVRYSSYTGTLPEITSVTFQVVGFRILIRPIGGISCLYRSTAEAPLVFNAPVTRERIFDRAVIVNASRIPLNAPTMGCPGILEIRGEGSMTVAGEFASVQIRLI
jgi:hypothetical protein